MLNVGILTISNCDGPPMSVENDDPELLRHVCEDIAMPCFHNAAQMFNPKIKATPLFLRTANYCPADCKEKYDDDVSCQWEFRLEP